MFSLPHLLSPSTHSLPSKQLYCQSNTCFPFSFPLSFLSFFLFPKALSFQLFSSPKYTKTLVHCSLYPTCYLLLRTLYPPNNSTANQILAFLSLFLYPFFLSFYSLRHSLFSSFLLQNTLKHLSIVLFTPPAISFYALSTLQTTLLPIKYLLSFLFSFILSFFLSFYSLRHSLFSSFLLQNTLKHLSIVLFTPPAISFYALSTLQTTLLPIKYLLSFLFSFILSFFLSFYSLRHSLFSSFLLQNTLKHLSIVLFTPPAISFYALSTLQTTLLPIKYLLSFLFSFILSFFLSFYSLRHSLFSSFLLQNTLKHLSIVLFTPPAISFYALSTLQTTLLPIKYLLSFLFSFILSFFLSFYSLRHSLFSSFLLQNTLKHLSIVLFTPPAISFYALSTLQTTLLPIKYLLSFLFSFILSFFLSFYSLRHSLFSSFLLQNTLKHLSIVLFTPPAISFYALSTLQTTLLPIKYLLSFLFSFILSFFLSFYSLRHSLFSSFLLQNTLKHLSIVLFTPPAISFYALSTLQTTLLPIKYLLSFLFSFILSFFLSFYSLRHSLFSSFLLQNTLKHLSIVLFTPPAISFYALSTLQTTLLPIKYLLSFLFSFILSFFLSIP